MFRNWPIDLTGCRFGPIFMSQLLSSKPSHPTQWSIKNGLQLVLAPVLISICGPNRLKNSKCLCLPSFLVLRLNNWWSSGHGWFLIVHHSRLIEIPRQLRPVFLLSGRYRRPPWAVIAHLSHWSLPLTVEGRVKALCAKRSILPSHPHVQDHLNIELLIGLLKRRTANQDFLCA